MSPCLWRAKQCASERGRPASNKINGERRFQQRDRFAHGRDMHVRTGFVLVFALLTGRAGRRTVQRGERPPDALGTPLCGVCRGCPRTALLRILAPWRAVLARLALHALLLLPLRLVSARRARGAIPLWVRRVGACLALHFLCRTRLAVCAHSALLALLDAAAVLECAGLALLARGVSDCTQVRAGLG